MTKTQLYDRVRIAKHLVRFLPFSPSRVRRPDWHAIKDYDGGVTVEMRAAETITMPDILTLFAAVKVFLDSAHDFPGSVRREPEGAVSVTIPFQSFLGDYLGVGRHDYGQVRKVLDRLTGYRVTVRRPDFVADWDHFTGHSVASDGRRKLLTLAIPERFYLECRKGLVLDYDMLRGIKGHVAQALFVYVSGQSGTRFYLATLERALGLRNSSGDAGTRKYNRRVIREAFTELAERGAVHDLWDLDGDHGHRFFFRPVRDSRQEKG